MCDAHYKLLITLLHKRPKYAEVYIRELFGRMDCPGTIPLKDEVREYLGNEVLHRILKFEATTQDTSRAVQAQLHFRLDHTWELRNA